MKGVSFEVVKGKCAKYVEILLSIFKNMFGVTSKQKDRFVVFNGRLLVGRFYMLYGAHLTLIIE